MEQGLYLITPENTDIKTLTDRFNRFCAKQTPDALLFTPAGQTAAELRPFIQAVQAKNVAFIIKNDVALAKAADADGVQIDYSAEIKKARALIGDMALGVLCATRDEAMRAGEAGADYVGFTSAELTQWWSELFNVPCVDFTTDSDDFADFKVALLDG